MVQAASAVVPVLTKRLPKKQRIVVWLLTTLAVAALTKMSRTSTSGSTAR